MNCPADFGHAPDLRWFRVHPGPHRPGPFIPLFAHELDTVLAEARLNNVLEQLTHRRVVPHRNRFQVQEADFRLRRLLDPVELNDHP